ncbi:hypothetical protein LCGC14_3078040, partial [marine sediment metagenome]
MVVQPGVTESKAGTMPNTDGQAKVTPSKKGKTPGGASKVSPEGTPTITQKEQEAAIHAAKSEAGRAVKAREEALVLREQAVKDAATAEAGRQATRDAEELEAAKDDPAGLT